MHFEGVFDVAVPRARVFDVVTDPQRVAGCMPDLQKVDVRSPDEFDALVRVGVGFIRGEFTMHFRVIEKEPQSRVKFKAHGSGLGSAIDLEISVKLLEGQNGKTSMNWAADATVSGRIASLGQRMMESQGEKIIRQFFDCFRKTTEVS